jgi:hypothetical protein
VDGRYFLVLIPSPENHECYQVLTMEIASLSLIKGNVFYRSAFVAKEAIQRKPGSVPTYYDVYICDVPRHHKAKIRLFKFHYPNYRSKTSVSTFLEPGS